MRTSLRESARTGEQATGGKGGEEKSWTSSSAGIHPARRAIVVVDEARGRRNADVAIRGRASRRPDGIARIRDGALIDESVWPARVRDTVHGACAAFQSTVATCHGGETFLAATGERVAVCLGIALPLAYVRGIRARR